MKPGEIIDTECAACKKPLKVKWDHGIVTDPEYQLIADWIYCTPCWEEMLKDYNP